MLDKFVKRMEEYHELQVHFDDMDFLFDFDELDDFYNQYENDKLISLLS